MRRICDVAYRVLVVAVLEHRFGCDNFVCPRPIQVDKGVCSCESPLQRGWCVFSGPCNRDLESDAHPPSIM